MPRLSSFEVIARTLQAPLVPVFYHADAAYAQSIVRACYAGGIRVFEFTNRGANAFEVFQELAKLTATDCPDLVLGIGTIYNAADAERFIAAGAAFVVQPVTTADVAATCQRHDVAWLPGALTPGEIFAATQLGAQIVKIFPGNLVGPDYIKSLRGPMPTTKLMVTGGVEPTEASLTEWFGAGVNVVGIGSQLFKGVGDPAAITARVAPLMTFLQARTLPSMNPTLRPSPPGTDTSVVGRYRWTICSLVFFATTINYLDRAVISLLKPYLEKAFGWNSGDYANIEIAFKLAYAVGMVGVGRIIDKLGTKIGYALSTTLWSIAAMGHALVSSTLGFGVARGFLGLTEAGNFPAAIKTTAEWFPQRERALATGIFNSGSNVGAIVAPLTVPWMAEHWGWQSAFLVTGALGFIWLVLWMNIYQTPAESKRLSKSEFDYINADIPVGLPAEGVVEEKPKVGWLPLLGFRQTWAFVIGKFITDPIWWFYLFWLPDFLSKQYHLTGTAIALPVAAVYILSSVGSVGGGYLPLGFIRRGMPAFQARKTAMLLIAFCVFPIVFAQWLGGMNMWLAVLVIGIAAAAHQAWSANIFTTVSDMFPKRAVASVTGIGGMAGGLGGIALTALVQKRMFVHYEAIGQLSKAYYIMFFICGAAYLLAWVLMFTLVPRMEPIKLDESDTLPTAS